MDETVIFVPHTHPRDLRHAALNVVVASVLLPMLDCATVVSTGAAVAVSFMSVARILGIPSIYIESAARLNGPSLTGRILQLLPGVTLLCQNRSWSDARWRYAGSVFDEFELEETHAAAHPVRKVLVTLGTIEGYGFERAIRRLREVLDDEQDVVWQVGNTSLTQLPNTAVRQMSQSQLRSELSTADVVVAHAGIGSALDVLDAGKCPVLMPRRAAFKEHVDDHQLQIANELDARGLALSRDADTVSFEDLVEAASLKVRRVTPPPLVF